MLNTACLLPQRVEELVCIGAGWRAPARAPHAFDGLGRNVAGHRGKRQRVGDEGLRRIELAGADQGGAELGVGIGVVDDDIDVGVVSDDLTGLGIERGLRRVEDYRSLELAALCRPGRREFLARPSP